MTGGFDNFGVVLILAFVLFVFTAFGVVLILWIALPFSVFGTKGLLKKVIEEQERMNRLLSSIDAGIRRISERESVRKEEPPPPPPPPPPGDSGSPF